MRKMPAEGMSIFTFVVFKSASFSNLVISNKKQLSTDCFNLAERTRHHSNFYKKEKRICWSNHKGKIELEVKGNLMSLYISVSATSHVRFQQQAFNIEK